MSQLCKLDRFSRSPRSCPKE